MNSKRLFFTTAFGLFFVFTSAQKPLENYQNIFSNDYDKAVLFLKEEKWMDDWILLYRINPKELKAVVFPELIRYNSFQDKIETFALESLYSLSGKSYANFSIGQFQIKPSFAERIEIDFLKLPKDKSISGWRPQPSDTVQNQANRSIRVKRLKDKKSMVTYVCLFFKIMEAKYPQWQSEEQKIKFFACAYNYDYRKSQKEIEAFLSKKFFQTGLSISATKYCYADIAWDFYQKQ